MGLINRLQGQIRIRVECPFPEQVLNICGTEKITFWDLVWESPVTFTCWLNRSNYQALVWSVRHLDCELTVLNREGVPYFLQRLQQRTSLLIGLVACGLGLFLSSFLIFDIQIEGNQNVSDEAILRSLSQNGVKQGTFGLSLDTENIRNHVLLDIPELSWISVNVSGCRATVQVRERIPAPNMLDLDTPMNMIARRAGLVLQILSLGGVNQVVPGTMVEEGQLLVSGAEDTGTFGSRLLAGTGSILARTWYTLTAPVSLDIRQKNYTDEIRTVYSLTIGTRRFPLSFSEVNPANCDKTVQRNILSIFGIPLPVTLGKEQYIYYDETPAELTQAETEQRVGDALAAYLSTLVEPYGRIESTLCSSQSKNGTVWVTLRAECQEEIGVQIPILTDVQTSPAS